MVFLTRSLLPVIFPTASSSNVWLLYKPFESPHGLFSVLVLGVAPLGSAAYVFVNGMSQRRKATLLGARLIPCVQGQPWPENLDKIVDIVLRSENKYLGTISVSAFRVHALLLPQDDLC